MTVNEFMNTLYSKVVSIVFLVSFVLMSAF